MEYLKELSDNPGPNGGPSDRQQAIERAFRKVAETEEGHVVFRILFEICGVFTPAMNEEQRIRRNLGIELMQLFPNAESRLYKAVLPQQERQ